MERHLTPDEAWKDFYEWMKARKKSGEFKRIPADIQEAQYAFEKKRKYTLGYKRIVRILETYGPGRYRVEVSFVLLQQ